MAEYKEYRIAVDNNLVGLEQVGVGGRDPQIANKSTTSDDSTSGSKESVSKTIALHMGQQAITYAFSNYGELTGDHIGQENINAVLQVGGMGLMIAKGGWAGAAVVAGQLAYQGINRFTDVRKSRIASRNIQQRRGMESREGR